MRVWLLVWISVYLNTLPSVERSGLCGGDGADVGRIAGAARRNVGAGTVRRAALRKTRVGVVRAADCRCYRATMPTGRARDTVER